MRGDVAGVDGPDDRRAEVARYLDHVAEQQRGLEGMGELTAPPGRVRANLRLVENGAEREAADLGLETCHEVGVALLEAARGAPRAAAG